MNNKQRTLLANHFDMAQLACSGGQNVFWILDLDDSLAFETAKGGNTAESLTAYRNQQRELGNIAASTMTTPEEALHDFRKNIQKQPPIDKAPAGFIWVVLICDGSVTCALQPSYVNVELIGVGIDGTKEGVILTSFNAA